MEQGKGYDFTPNKTLGHVLKGFDQLFKKWIKIMTNSKAGRHQLWRETKAGVLILFHPISFPVPCGALAVIGKYALPNRLF